MTVYCTPDYLGREERKTFLRGMPSTHGVTREIVREVKNPSHETAAMLMTKENMEQVVPLKTNRVIS